MENSLLPASGRHERNVAVGCPQDSCLLLCGSKIRFSATERNREIRLSPSKDLVIAVEGNMADEVAQSASFALRRVSKWSVFSKATFNTTKSEVLSATTRRKSANVTVHYEGVKLRQVRNLKYVGIVFTEKTYVDHVH